MQCTFNFIVVKNFCSELLTKLLSLIVVCIFYVHLTYNTYLELYTYTSVAVNELVNFISLVHFVIMTSE